ncbi:MAG: hypothetical protein OK404_01640 [Thaumarchaeota archaeon]|nr:hypothetical protein [Nitrososphaerota archaeon]
MPDIPPPGAPAVVGEALRIVETAKEKRITLRMFGAAAIFQHCPKYGHLFQAMGRIPGDIDLASYDKYSSKVAEVIQGLGYEEDMTVTAFGSGRLIFSRTSDGLHCDVFLGKLEMSHVISFDHRLELDYPTVSLADLFLSKMQIFKLNEKDAVDTIVLLREHPMGPSDNETINSGYVIHLCSKDWGLWRTVNDNLKKVSALLPNYSALDKGDKDDVESKIASLLASLESVPKSLSWKVRARVGDSRKWYNEVDDVYR